jgi:hypothetical protein
MSTKKTPAKKVAKKSPAQKVAAKKKPAPKKGLAKKVLSRKAAKAKLPTTRKVAVKQTELDKMIAKINEAKSNGQKSVVVYTTSKDSHKANTGGSGFGASDLKPKLLEAYKHLLVNYDLETKLVNMNEMAVEWVVKIKK